MGFILTKAIKPPQTPPKSQVKSYPASHQNLARSGPCQAWARHGPALAWHCLLHGQITKPCGMAMWPGRTLAFTMQLKRWG